MTPDTQAGVSEDIVNAMRKDMLKTINFARGQAGISPVTLGRNHSPQAHSEYQRDTCIVSHTGSGGSDMVDRWFQNGGGDYATIGENVSGWLDCLYRVPRSHTLYRYVAEQFDGLMESPGHRRNILHRDFDEVHLGFAVSPLWVMDNAGLRWPVVRLTGDTSGMTEKDRKSRLMNWPTRQAFVALLASTAMLTLVAISCTEVVVVTVEVEVTREVPVTRIVEVTRVVEAITRQTRDTVGTEAAVEACSGIVGLMLRLVGSFDPSTGQPTMTVEEAGRGWFPIIANVYDSGR